MKGWDHFRFDCLSDSRGGGKVGVGGSLLACPGKSSERMPLNRDSWNEGRPFILMLISSLEMRLVWLYLIAISSYFRAGLSW